MDIPKIKQHLTRLGKGTDWLAQRLNLNTEVLDAWMNGVAPPSPVTLVINLHLSDELIVPVPIEIEHYLALEIRAEDEGIPIADFLAKMVRDSIITAP